MRLQLRALDPGRNSAQFNDGWFQVTQFKGIVRAGKRDLAKPR